MKKNVKRIEPKRPSNIATKKRFPIARSAEDWQHLAGELKHSKAPTIEEFYLNLDIPRATFYDAVNKYDCMREALTYKLERIGIEREKLCIDRNLSMNTVTAFPLSNYLERVKMNFEWREKLKDNQGTTPPKIIIVEKPVFMNRADDE